MARLQLLCHGPTSATRAAAFPADEPLEAAAIDRLKAGHVILRAARRHMTSPERRARQTAEALRIDAASVPALRECDYGSWAGRSFDEVAQEDAAGLADWMRDPDAVPHGGESLAAVMRRVADWLTTHPQGDPTLVVTHATIIRSAIVFALGAPPSSFWRIDIAPLTCTTLKGRDGRWTLEGLASPATN